MTAYANANALATLYRPTASVLDARSPAASMAVDRQPAQAAPIMVVLAGSASGTVTVAGTVSGAADTETLTWSGAAGSRVTVKSFSALSGFTSSLTGATSVRADAVGKGGAPLTATLRTIASGVPVGVRRKNQANWSGGVAGHERQSDATCVWPYEDTYEPAAGDLIDADGVTYEAVRVERRGGGLRPTTWLIELRERAGRL